MNVLQKINKAVENIKCLFVENILRFIMIGFFILLMIFSSIFLNTNPLITLNSLALHMNKNNLISISFSETMHFYDEGITVEIFASNKNACIFYTTDGSMPTIKSNIYEGPIYFGLQDEIYAVVLRAIAVLNGSYSAPKTHTFFIGQDIHERFDTMVFSLSTNPEYLFNFDTGILIEGKNRALYVLENPETEIFPWSPANFNLRGREWEPPTHVETFTSNGERIVSQLAGMRVHGGFSRGQEQKSLRLIARRDYTPEMGKFHFDFFPDEYTNRGIPLLRFDTLILQNGGGTYAFSMLRNTLGTTLARNAGFRVATPAKGVSVFLNGEYYGFAWLIVRINAHYLQDIFNAPTREFDIIDSRNMWWETYCEHILTDIRTKLSFSDKDLRDDSIFSEFKTIVDVENMLMFYAIQIFLGNTDWPHNNSRLWRYTGENNINQTSELDGRWRFAIWDLDNTFGFGEYFGWMPVETFLRVLETDRLFANILSRTDMADLFTIMINDLSANIINANSVRTAINEIFNVYVWNEVNHWVELRRLSLGTIYWNHREIIEWTKVRHKYIFENLSQFFSFCLNMYTVQIIGGEAIIGTQRGTSSHYFNHLVVPISPVLPEFTSFDHWLLNGERIYTADINVSIADAIDGYVMLEIVTQPAIPPLVISDIYVTERGNGTVLLNPHDTSIRTTGLFLSNNFYNLHMWQLPAATVPAGEILELVGRQTSDFNHRFRIQMNFDIRNGQVLFLSNANGQILDRFTVRYNTAPRNLSLILNR